MGENIAHEEITKTLESVQLLSNFNHLRNASVYLSGPMGYVASRTDEKKFGWRTRVGQFLNKFEVTVFDPWLKPVENNQENYEDETDIVVDLKKKWSFEPTQTGSEIRSQSSEKFRPTMNSDLNMVDNSDFIIAYCPTNVYSVGTVHEIVRAREQGKLVLFVSPIIAFPALDLLSEHLKNDKRGLELLEQLISQVPIKINSNGVPSPWYMSLIGTDTFFDGFGFKQYAQEFNWPKNPIDDLEDKYVPHNPLLPYLENMAKGLAKYSNYQSKQ